MQVLGNRVGTNMVAATRMTRVVVRLPGNRVGFQYGCNDEDDEGSRTAPRMIRVLVRFQGRKVPVRLLRRGCSVLQLQGDRVDGANEVDKGSSAAPRNSGMFPKQIPQ